MNQTLTFGIEEAINAVVEAGFLVSSITLRSLALAPNEIGELVAGSPPVYTEHYSDLPCMIGIPASNARMGGENRTGDLTQVSTNRTVVLDGHYEDIVPLMDAVVDEIEYNVLAVIHDSQKTVTELTLERITI